MATAITTPPRTSITTPPKTPPPAATLITRTAYPKWWKDERTAAINISAGGTQEVIKLWTGRKLFISTIVLTVSKETDIYFQMGIFGNTGTMHFGGADEPKGIVIAMGNSPAPAGPGPFKVTSSATDAAVGGFIVYYQEKEIIQKVTKKKI